MTDADFKLLLTLFMVSDPWPLSEEEHRATEEYLDREARSRGWKDWVGAYHSESKVPIGETRDEMSARHQLETIAAAKKPEPLSREEIAQMAEEERARTYEWDEMMRRDDAETYLDKLNQTPDLRRIARDGSIEVEMVKPCGCGCVCHVCENGHSSGQHTEPCQSTVLG